MTPYPKEEQKKPFMYWDAEDGVTAASALIKRYVFVVVSFVILSSMKKISCLALTKTYLLISADAVAFFEVC
jgi:hypothetical protein